MSKFKFSHFAGNIELADISIEVSTNGTHYKLHATKNGYQAESSVVHVMTIKEYNDLPHCIYDTAVRFLAAAKLCGIYFY